MTGLAVTERHPSLPDPAAPLTASGNLRRRAAVSRAISGFATASALVAVALLVDVAYTVVDKGASSVSWSFLTQNSRGLAGGGIANALIGTGVIVVVGAVIAVPVGVLTGLYLTEFAGPQSRSGRAMKLALDLLQGLPTIIVGIVVYGLIVAAEHKETGFAGSIALAIVMLPMIARSSQEVLRLVPGSLREAADALGVQRWRTVLGVVLPSAVGGIATGAILAIARAAGETAPLLAVDSLYRPPPNCRSSDTECRASRSSSTRPMTCRPRLRSGWPGAPHWSCLRASWWPMSSRDCCSRAPSGNWACDGQGSQPEPAARG